MSTKRNVLDLALTEVSKRYISIKDDNLKTSQEVFKTVFDQVKRKMDEKCNFFKTYSSQVLYGGSVADGIKVSKLDEFDMDIVIRLPINRDDGPDGIIIENDQPGFVKMRIINAFDNLDKQQHWESRHKVTRDWRDTDKYFLQNKFRNWLQGIVQKAISDMKMQVEVNGVKYLLTYKESGPAYTLNIRNDVGNEEFALDVDIVPVIKFSSPRWPNNYRTVNGLCSKDWLVVPKPNKSIMDNKLKNRCWRLSFQDFEREMIKGCQCLKSTIRLVKKLRDALEMKAIASYYIKTLFLWKVSKTNRLYWQNKLSVTFRDMVKEFYDAVDNKNIPYFWQEKNNLIENLKPTLRSSYLMKLKNVLDAIVDNDVETVVAAILTREERTEFIKSEFYQRELVKQISIDSGISVNLSDQIIMLENEIHSSRDQMNNNQFEILELRVSELSDRVASVEERLKSLELGMLEDRVERLELQKCLMKLGSVNIENGRMNKVDAITPAAGTLQCIEPCGMHVNRPSTTKTTPIIWKTSLKTVMTQITKQKNLCTQSPPKYRPNDQNDLDSTAPSPITIRKDKMKPASFKCCQFCHKMYATLGDLGNHERKCRLLYGDESNEISSTCSDICP